MKTIISASHKLHLDGSEIKLEKTQLMARPADIPEGYIAYNPSGIAIERDSDGHDHSVVFLRVEPDSENHLGKTSSIAYEIDPHNLKKLPRRYHGIQLPGEDPAVKRVPVSNVDGEVSWRWLVSTVTARPAVGLPDGVAFETTFWSVDRLEGLLDPALKPLATGPDRMKEVRVAPVGGDSESGAPESGARLLVLGRPQITPAHGTISAIVIDKIKDLVAGNIAAAPVVDSELFSQDRNADPSVLKKGAANDAIWLDGERFLVLGHAAWATGAPEYKGRHYEATLYELDYAAGRIADLGTLATRADFASAKAKKDALDLSDVVFPGGFCYDESGAAVPLAAVGQREKHLVTFGVSDSQWAVGVVSCSREMLSHGRPPLAVKK